MGGAPAFLSFLAPSNTTLNLEDLSLIKISVKNLPNFIFTS